MSIFEKIVVLWLVFNSGFIVYLIWSYHKFKNWYLLHPEELEEYND